jgi:hypothetical protein
VILGCEDFDAELAQRYGWINRALPGAELRPFVRALAQRIASFPREAIALAKRAVDAADTTVRDGLLEEAHLFNRTLASAEARGRMDAFVSSGSQNPETELDLGAVLAHVVRVQVSD